MKDNIEEIIHAFSDKMEICCNYLLNINNFYSSDKEINYLIIETLLNLILRVPSDGNIVYYTMIFVNLIKQNKVFHNLLSEIIDNYIIQNINIMDLESIINFSKFLSLYISNNQFSYEYNRLEGDGIKHKLFLKIFIENLVNLATRVRMKDLLPSGLQSYLPEEDKPHWK